MNKTLIAIKAILSFVLGFLAGAALLAWVGMISLDQQKLTFMLGNSSRTVLVLQDLQRGDNKGVIATLEPILNRHLKSIAEMVDANNDLRSNQDILRIARKVRDYRAKFPSHPQNPGADETLNHLLELMGEKRTN
ncbi:MAG: hypothetical protein HZA91_14810 [Verrucomicrobia bacterium]|nr:hypothetical protein [Verrucomicrobiota bacterium]